ncbi:uncharacterized protein B0T15DRAFT_433406 [Chaetomium strumarium]|uniref:F-box domain-containing protein n=1 Tax=Chaetomium strumarium TaxID=1170767 RepID=A0AAJ0GXR5_9PEZI|nr:hypothetical protein B0T15DRAFT_433406 [Chaetomium strumarium]
MASLNSASQPCTLASLPLELLAQILSLLPSLVDLKAAVQATSIFHQAYLSDRKRILYVILHATLGNRVFVDAYAVQTTLHFQHLDYLARHDAVEHFVTFIHQRYPVLPTNTILQLPECSVEGLAGISSFFSSTIRPLLQNVFQMFLQKIPLGVEIDPISTLETRQIMRALYRFELWCSLHGAGSGTSPDYPLLLHAGPVNLLMNLFEVYEPWELEEIACIYTLLHKMYKGIFDDVRERFEEEDKALEEANKADAHERYFFPVRRSLHVATHQSTFPEPTYWQTLGIPREDWRNGALSKGLRWHLRVMRASDVFAKLRMILSEVAFLADETSLARALSWEAQTHRRQVQPSSRDGLEPPDLVRISDRLRVTELRQLLLLFGDGAEDKQPLGWVVVFRGKYCNWYGGVLPWELKCWGWVFWDSQRLEKTGMLEKLAGPWTGEPPW